MDKAPDAFRTISEVADYLDTPAHVLRFWETRFPQVKPVKGAGGRRYYRPSDVALLAGIRRLLHTDGLTIRGVQKILRENGVRHVAELEGPPLPVAEPLADLLPPPRPPAEIVPLRPDPAPPATGTGFGGFGLDLDAPGPGEGGFIAFSGLAPAQPDSPPQGLSAPEPARPPSRQPSLFDLDPPVPEAPHVFVEPDEEPAPVARFSPPEAPAPDDLAEAEAAIAALIAVAEPAADSPPAEPAPALPDAPLAGLAPRLRALPLPDAQTRSALADLQARLGLLQAQMAEAATRARRNSGA